MRGRPLGPLSQPPSLCTQETVALCCPWSCWGNWGGGVMGCQPAPSLGGWEQPPRGAPEPEGRGCTSCRPQPRTSLFFPPRRETGNTSLVSEQTRLCLGPLSLVGVGQPSTFSWAVWVWGSWPPVLDQNSAGQPQRPGNGRDFTLTQHPMGRSQENGLKLCRKKWQRC